MCDVPMVARRAQDRDAQLPALLCEGRGWARSVHGAQGAAKDARHDLSEVEFVGEAVNLKSSVESLAQRRREAESAEKVQKSDGKEKHDKKNLGNLFHPIGEINTCSSNGITSANFASPRLCVRYNMEWLIEMRNLG